MWDFNLDLLKVDTDHLTQHFFMVYGSLPHILQPTGVTDHTTTVIDNIFSNNLQDDISGNVLLYLTTLLKWYVNREQINVYQRDNSKFSRESFRDVSIQNWCYSHDNVNDSFKDFYTKLEASVDRHAPLKKLTPKEIKIKNKPWLSIEILKMIKIRNIIFARKKSNLKMKTVKYYIIYKETELTGNLKNQRRSTMLITLLNMLRT